MRKSTLFISAMLTAFLVAILFGVVSAYQQMTQTAEAAPQAATAQPMVAVFPPTFTPTPVPVVVVSPERATTIAAEFLGSTDVYSVEVVDYEGAQAFLVTFSSGDLVYVGSDGRVLANSKIQPVVVVTSGGGGNGGGGGSQSSNNDSNIGTDGGNQTGGGYEDHDDGEHEDHEDDGHEGNDD